MMYGYNVAATHYVLVQGTMYLYIVQGTLYANVRALCTFCTSLYVTHTGTHTGRLGLV